MSESTTETITKFLKQMAEQDNRGTAAPYYYVINSEEEYMSDPRDSDESRVQHDDSEYESFEAMEKQLLEDGYESDEVAIMVREASEFGVSKRWVRHRMFLTDKEAKSHLASNKHHYSSNAHTYVCHAWRAPELEAFMRALFKHFEVDTGKQFL